MAPKKISPATREREGRQAKFLAGLVLGKTVAEAAIYAGVSRRVVYDWKDQSKSFSNSWEDSIQESVELTLNKYELELKDRALDRADKNSHLLLMFIIKKLNPEYRDNYKTETKVVHEKVQEISFNQSEMDKALEILTTAKEAGSPDIPDSD